MRKIIDGVTYNTETSTKLAQAEWTDDGDVVGVLYLTRGGAYYLDKEITTKVWSERERGHVDRVRNVFEPMSPEEAHKWMLEGEVEVFNNPLADPPEATAEAEPGETLYVRLPAALKRRIEQAATKENVSGNVWAMRCLERCLNG